MIKDQFEPVHTLNWIFWDFSGLSNKLLYERTADQKKKKKKSYLLYKFAAELST